MKTSRTLAGCVALAMAPAACIDSTPFVAADLGIPDVPTVDASVPEATIVACVQCLQSPSSPGPGCQDVYEACTANAQCSAIIDCAIAKGCLSGTGEAVFSCIPPCLIQNGVGSGGDPVLNLSGPVNDCAIGPCHPACEVSP